LRRNGSRIELYISHLYPFIYFKKAYESVRSEVFLYNITEFGAPTKLIRPVKKCNCMQEEIKRRLNLGNACYHSVQSLLSSCLLSRNVKVKMYKTIILPVILCGCETWSLTLREEHRLMVFENRVLRRMFGPKRDEVTGEWRKLHSEELHNLTHHQILLSRSDEVGSTCGMHGRGEEVYRVLMGKPEGKRPLQRPGHRWEDRIKMDFREIGWVCGGFT
jgi:hypothetical protein